MKQQFEIITRQLMFWVIGAQLLFSSAAFSQNLFIQNYTYQKGIVYLSAFSSRGGVTCAKSKMIKPMSPWYLTDNQLFNMCKVPVSCNHFIIGAYFPDQQKTIECRPIAWKPHDIGPATLVIDDLDCRIVSY